jgi:leucyl-tRNA synthetase
LNRVWRLVEQHEAVCNKKDEHDDKMTDLKRKTHETIKKVTEDMEGAFHFNTALSAIMELVNEIYSCLTFGGPQLKKSIETVIILLAPFVPHISAEMWERLGKKTGIFEAEWPVYEEAAMGRDMISMAVQINGKVRSKIDVPSAAGEDEIKKIILDDKTVGKWIEGKQPKKFIVVKGRLVNLVV